MSAGTEEMTKKQQTMEELCRDVDFRRKSRKGEQYCLVNEKECPYYEPSKKISVESNGIGFGNDTHYVSYNGCKRFD